jgi:hypothetical protein
MAKSRGTTIRISGPGTADALAALLGKPQKPMDLVEVANSIAETIGKVTTPLTDEQRTFLAAAIGPWLDRAAQRR